MLRQLLNMWNTFKFYQKWSSHCSTVGSCGILGCLEKGSILGLAQWVKDPVLHSWGLHCNCRSDQIWCCGSAKKNKQTKKFYRKRWQILKHLLVLDEKASLVWKSHLQRQLHSSESIYDWKTITFTINWMPVTWLCVVWSNVEMASMQNHNSLSLSLKNNSGKLLPCKVTGWFRKLHLQQYEGCGDSS